MQNEKFTLNSENHKSGKTHKNILILHFTPIFQKLLFLMLVLVKDNCVTFRFLEFDFLYYI